jgi:hypothetical protein
MSYHNATNKYYNPPFLAKVLLLVIILAGGVLVDRKLLHNVVKLRKGETALNKVDRVSRQAGFNN